MSHLFHLRLGVHSDRCYLAWSVYLPSASWCLSSLPCPVPGKTQPCISWWRPHMLWVCSGWMCEEKCDLCRFGGDWSPAPSLGEGSCRGGPPSVSTLPGSTLTTLSHTHLLGSVLVHGSCSFFFSSIKSNFGCHFHYCKAAYACVESIRNVDK